MYCRNCGRLNDDNNYKCAGCGNIVQDLTAETPVPVDGFVPDRSAMAIVSLILPFFCCCFPGFLSLPFGIVALVFSADVKKKLSLGNLEGAKKSSKTALMWIWIAFGAALLGILSWIAVINTFGYQFRNPSKWY
ncbi:MAG: CD225/dispanin family protein [Candidatus Firestonebacteria bacterium]